MVWDPQTRAAGEGPGLTGIQLSIMLSGLMEDCWTTSAFSLFQFFFLVAEHVDVQPLAAR